MGESLSNKFPNLQKLSLSNNCIGADGIESLVSKLGPGCSLANLELRNQQQAVDEEDLDRILQHLVERFGRWFFTRFKVEEWQCISRN